MLRDIFTAAGINSVAAVNAQALRPANRRLFDSLPCETELYCVFFTVPYLCRRPKPPLSAYAEVPDYHLFINRLAPEVEGYFSAAYPGRFARMYSDHSPFAEVFGAAKAGLGIIGENSLLITPLHSSFVFIGECVCALSRHELTAEGIPVENCDIRYCQNCGACKRACPGGCAGLADRTGCISALNQKKKLEEWEADAVARSGWIWGCDVCQSVCPHTIRAIENGSAYTRITFFTEGCINGNDPAAAVSAMNDEEFARYPFSWRPRRVIERNIRLCAGEAESEN